MDVKARWFAELRSDEDIADFYSTISLEQLPVLILGGGSNVLFTKDFPGSIAYIRSKGIVKLMEDDRHIYLKIAAGEVWDDVVNYTVDNGWGGIENLSMIPGSIGAAPVQNIGAYGVEIKDVIWSVEVADIAARHYRAFRPADCDFGYRSSIFKKQGKDRLVVTSVCLKLDKQPVLNIDYGDIRIELEKSGIMQPTIADVRNTIMAIRRRKLPDPAVIGNAGSFFKNPIVTAEELESLTSDHPGIVAFAHNDSFKLAAAWLIEQCGWKGFREGDAGVHPHQPLVLVNYGAATGKDILHLANRIIESVNARFGVSLEPEVLVV